MSHLDRLSSLLANFEVRCHQTADRATSNLFILGNESAVNRLEFYIKGAVPKATQSSALTCMHVDMGGENCPLQLAMPDVVNINLEKDTQIHALANLITQEAATPRCGGQFALDRLADLLVLNVLRSQLMRDTLEPGMFAGLAHRQLRKVIVAMHDSPSQKWRVEDFAEMAAMSRSSFMSEFQSVVGKTPMAYLNHWRMTLAKTAVQKGERVKEVANKFGYSSGDAFCRAFTAQYGVAPTKLNTVM